MGILSTICSNTRKPEGFFGHMMVNGMNGGGHARMAEWGLAEVTIANEDDGLSGINKKWEKMIEGMHTYTPDELRTHLTAAGFRDIAVHTNDQHHWLCATAAK
jgi:hypothetical protein